LVLDAHAPDARGGSSSFSTRETGRALDGLGRFDVLFFDACLMGMIESAYEVQPFTDYLIAGENLLWSRLPYQRYLNPSILTAGTTPRELAQSIVRLYNQPVVSEEPFAIAAIDMRKLPGLVELTNTLAQRLLDRLHKDPSAEAQIRAAYAAAQKFDSDSSYSIDATDNYVDLADFARQLRGANISETITASADAVVEAVGVRGPADRVVLATSALSGTTRFAEQPWSFPGAYGLSIYLPLGERDCRPTGLPIDDVTQPAVSPCLAPPTAKVDDFQIEPQLPYYANAGQLTFTRDAPYWAALLTHLDITTPNRAPDRPSPRSPFPGKSEAERFYVFLFQVRR
jgi:hypothetical protein